ncbi:ABC transporter substrate-binding protein [Aeromonas allosaccharophila]|uniref:ABC transporter substrate-binding protein n=1 Tax=Aeromonas allosaccharophila TaxID=656 RepID=UPI000F930A0C
MKKAFYLAPVFVAMLGLVGCDKQEEKTTIEFMHSWVEQDRQMVVASLIKKFEAAHPEITVKQVPVEEDAYNTKVITLASSGKLPEVLEVSHDYAKVMDKDHLIDREAVGQVISDVGADNYQEGILRIVRTEDGTSYTGSPINAWMQGIWYSKQALAQQGIAEPKNWQELSHAAQTLNNPANKKFGIALPTAESVMSEQVFSQFALSNGANVFNADGGITLDTPQMREALSFYQQLAKSSMPGSNDVMEIRDAFMNGTVPMAFYSTYMLPSIYAEGKAADLGFVLPSQKSSVVYGNVVSLTISSGLEEAEKSAAKEFVEFIEQPENAAELVLMSPGALLPAIKSVAKVEAYQNNEVVKTFAPLLTELSGEFKNLQAFGSVGDKNFTSMGDVTSSGALAEMVNQATVDNKSVEELIPVAQKKIEGMMAKRQ